MSTPPGPRLTFVTQWFAPEPANMPVWVAEAMRRQGWDVTVLTGIPNYPDGVVKSGYRATRPSRDMHDGIPVVRTPLYPSHDGSALGRIANYASWAISSTVLGRRTLRSSDAVLVYSSPATAALSAIWSRLRYQRPYVLLVQDLWPDSIFASGFLNRPAIRRVIEPVVDRFVRWGYRHAASIAVIAPGMRRTLIERGIPGDKVQVVYNWVDEDVFHPEVRSGVLRQAIGVPDDVPVFLFGGNIGAAQGLEPVVDAFLALGDAAHLVLLGDGIRRRDLQERARGAANIHFHEPVPVAQMTALQADADVLVVSLSADPLFAITLPSKTQASLAAGRAVLAVAGGDVADVVERAGAGVSARPGDAEDVARAVRHLVGLSAEDRRALGERAHTYYSTEMSEAVGAERLSGMLRTAATSTIDQQGDQ